MENQTKAYLFALLAVAGWSTVATAFKLALQYLDIFQLVFYASVISLLIYIVVLLIQEGPGFYKNIKKKDLLNSALLGALNPFAYYLLLLRAYDMLLAQEAGTLNYAWPIALVLLSIPLLKQKISGKSLLAVIISFTGIIFIASRGNLEAYHFENATGVVFALTSAIIWAIYWIYNLKDQRKDLHKLFLNFVFGTLYTGIALFIFSSPVIENLNGILSVIYIGFFELGITYILWMKALKYTTTTARISNLIFLAPFISLIIINLILKESIYWTTIAGLGLIITGILLQRYLSKREIVN